VIQNFGSELNQLL